MSGIVGIMVEAIAKKLLTEYLARAGNQGELQPVDPALIPASSPEIAQGLLKLIGANLLTTSQVEEIFLQLDKVTSISKLPVLERAVVAFKNLVNAKSTGNALPVNGILTSDALSRFLSIARCHGFLQTTPSNVPVPEPDPDEQDIPLRRIRYFIKGELPKMNDDSATDAALRVLQEAWINWLEVVKLDARQTHTEANANVLVFRQSLDAAVGGTLADAHVGPPNGMVFQLRIDTGEDGNWTKDKFRGTMTHEIGHLLGLTHATVDGQLMSPFYDPNVTKPTKADVKRLLALGYEAAPARSAGGKPTTGIV